MIIETNVLKNMFKKYSASYISEDGEVIRLNDLGFKTHWDYEKSLQAQGKIESGVLARQTVNLYSWVRLNDGSNFRGENVIELPIKGITEKQYEEIIKFLDYMQYISKHFVEVGIEERSSGVKFSSNALWCKRFDFSEYTTDEIVKEIRYAYNKLKYIEMEENK